LKNLVWVDDDGQLNVHDDQARSVVENVAAEINHPAQDANITVDENGNFVVVPAVFSAEVDIEASAAALEKSLTAGSTDVPLVVERKAPQITDEMAAEWADKADKLAGQGVTVTWDEESAPISRAELIWAMVIEPRPGEDEPFRLSFDRSVLTEQLQPIADAIYQKPQDVQLRLLDGEIKKHAAAVEGRQVDMEKSVSAIDKAARDGSFQAKLKIDEIDPKYTDADVNDINLYDVLGDSSTWYGDSSDPRRHNVERAVELENGWLVPPGGEFSYAQVMGLVTAENGFVTGFGIVADPDGGPGSVTTAPVIGGGICQVSTTIFQAAFWAGMEITERYQHPYWLLNYGEPPRGMKGLDAMVNIEPDWSLDLKFRNSTANWIAVVMTADGETVGAKIVGVDQGWTVQVDDPVLTNVVKSDPNKMIYTDSPELPKGQELQVEYAKDGFDASIKRTVRDKDGNIVSTYTLDSSYAASRNTTLRGTGTENIAGTGK
jgi:vancomycin resistance protein YoaR